VNQQEILDALAGLALFSDLDQPQLQAVAHTMSEESFPAGQRILRQGFSGSGFFVILDGEVMVRVDGADVATLGKGDFFGPLCIAGVYLNESVIKAWQDAGIRDSKNISSDKKIAELAEKIRKTPGCVANTVSIGNEAYNRL